MHHLSLPSPKIFYSDSSTSVPEKGEGKKNNKKIIIRRRRIKYYILKSKVCLNSSNRAFIFKIYFSKTVCLFSTPECRCPARRHDSWNDIFRSILSWFREKARQWSADCQLEVYAFYLGLNFNQALRFGTLRKGGGGNLENCAYLWESPRAIRSVTNFFFFYRMQQLLAHKVNH